MFLSLESQEKEGPEAEAAAVKLAIQLKEDGLLRAYGGVRQAREGCHFLSINCARCMSSNPSQIAQITWLQFRFPNAFTHLRSCA